MIFTEPGHSNKHKILLVSTISWDVLIAVMTRSKKIAVFINSTTAFIILNYICCNRVYLLYLKGEEKLGKSLEFGQHVYPILAEGYTAQKNIHAWTSLGTGKYLTTLAISGSVYLILRWLTETSVWWELKARCPGFYRKQKLVSVSSVTL